MTSAPDPIRDTSKQRRIDVILADWSSRSKQGERVDVLSIIAANPELEPELSIALSAHFRLEVKSASDTSLGSGSETGRRREIPSEYRQIGNYTVIREIARGGMGVVFEAIEPESQHRVAIKMILAGNLATDEEIRRFHNEAKVAASLRHPNIVPVEEVGNHRDQPYLVMPFISGPTLEEFRRGKHISPKVLAQYMLGAARGIAFAHTKNLLHRDIKPSNILIDDAGNARVTDFGLAKEFGRETRLTRTGQMLGTANYMAPEQAIPDFGPVTLCSDVFSLGATLYSLLTGKPPFDSEHYVGTLLQVSLCKIVPPQKITATADPGLSAIAMKCLAKDPTQRYETAELLATALEHYLDSLRPKRDLRLVRRRQRRIWFGRRRQALANSFQTGLGATIAAVHRIAKNTQTLVANCAAGIRQYGRQCLLTVAAIFAIVSLGWGMMQAGSHVVPIMLGLFSRPSVGSEPPPKSVGRIVELKGASIFTEWTTATDDFKVRQLFDVYPVDTPDPAKSTPKGQLVLVNRGETRGELLKYTGDEQFLKDDLLWPAKCGSQQQGDDVYLEFPIFPRQLIPGSTETVDLPFPAISPTDSNRRDALLKARQDALELRNDESPPTDEQRLRLQFDPMSQSPYWTRDPRFRAEVATLEGGTLLTEAAVARGLRWLANHQGSDGSWSLSGFNKAGSCNCSGGGHFSGKSPGTALAMLPFLGTGQTHLNGRYKNNVSQGLRWFIENQKADGDLRAGSTANEGMYTHGIATMVLCEAFAMTGDEQLRDPAQRACDFICKAQYKDGGWRYTTSPSPTSQLGDLSVTGWQVSALHAGKKAGLVIPEEVLYKADEFLNTVQHASGARYSYMKGQSPTHVMTAEGLFCRVELGWENQKPELTNGVEWLVKNHLPATSNPSVYYWYYGTQLMHNIGGPHWEQWNLKLREILISSQVSSGHAAGSWLPSGEHASAGGRIYMTALALRALEASYLEQPKFRTIVLSQPTLTTTYLPSKQQKHESVTVITSKPPQLIDDGPQPVSLQTTTNQEGMRFVRVHAGTYWMGSPKDEPSRGSDEDRVQVEITQPFYIGTTEVTQGLWTAIMGTNPWGAILPNDRSYPASNMSHAEARRFCEKLSEKTGSKYRLPTEAEWEYACRGGSTKAYSWGSHSDPDLFAWFGESKMTLHRVASKKPNAFGIYDMSGNVAEWCLDTYSRVRQVGKDPLISDAFVRYVVYRGGSSMSSQQSLRCAYRSTWTSGESYIGFRVILEIDPIVHEVYPRPEPVPPKKVPSSDSSVSLPSELAKLGRDRFFRNGVGGQMILISEGRFRMGTSADNSGRNGDETPVEVEITEPFYMAETEVTVEQWKRIFPDYSVPDSNNNNHPVTQVSYDEARFFCSKLTEADWRVKSNWKFELPTEAEWEYACRAGTTSAYSFGDRSEAFTEHGWSKDNSDDHVHPVKQKLANTWGLYDMHGNVSEWCLDRYRAALPGGRNPLNVVGDEKAIRSYVTRGGNFRNSPNGCRSVSREASDPNDRTTVLGFRIVLIKK